jgi:hypothetical protein
VALERACLKILVTNFLGDNDVWVVENTIIGEPSKMQMEAKVVLKPTKGMT